jgi:hypothetical protein
MRKTSEIDDLGYFKDELYITEIMKGDEFYQTFGHDEEEVKAYIELRRLEKTDIASSLVDSVRKE